MFRKRISNNEVQVRKPVVESIKLIRQNILRKKLGVIKKIRRIDKSKLDIECIVN